MKELSLHILDVVQNSFTAQATRVALTLTQVENSLTIVIADNGCGMTEAFLQAVTDPFTTTRTTRKVGLGLPLLKLASEMTGGGLQIESQVKVGTTVTATFHIDHIDCPPMGDLPATVALLVQGLPPGTDLIYTHGTPKGTFVLDTQELKEILGDVPLNEPEIVLWIQDYITEGM